MKFAIRQVVDEIKKTYLQKNKAYGNNAHYTYCRFGIASYALRLTDKANRYETLLNNKNIDKADESIADTLKDFITYAVMAAGDLYANSSDIADTYNIDMTLDIMDDIVKQSNLDMKKFVDTFSFNEHTADKPLKDVVYSLYLEAQESYSQGSDTAWLCFFELALWGVHLYLDYVSIKPKKGECK